MEYRYSTKCPAHGQTIETRRTQSLKHNGVEYAGPIFYCNRCKQYYLFSEGVKLKRRVRLIAPSGLSITVTSGAVTKNPVKKKGAKLDPAISKEKKDKPVETVKKTTSKKKAKHKAIIEKNNATKKRIQESLNQIRCEMNCPIHQDRIMTTKNSIDVEIYSGLPLFYCIDCEKYYISCSELEEKRIGRINRKDLVNCSCKVDVTNPDNGKLKNVGRFSSTEDLSKKANTSDNVKQLEENELENFFEWTEENTEEELFKDFIHEE